MEEEKELIDRIFADNSDYLHFKIASYLGKQGGARSTKVKYNASLDNLVKARLALKEKRGKCRGNISFEQEVWLYANPDKELARQVMDIAEGSKNTEQQVQADSDKPNSPNLTL